MLINSKSKIWKRKFLKSSKTSSSLGHIYFSLWRLSLALYLLLATAGEEIPIWMFNILPLHMTTSAYFLLSGKRFESDSWDSIFATINDLFTNNRGKIIIFYPTKSEDDGLRYFWISSQTPNNFSIEQLGRTSVPYLIQEESIGTGKTPFEVLSSRSLNKASRLNITLQTSLVNHLHKVALTHLLLWQIFEVYQKRTLSFTIPYNIKRNYPDFFH